MSPRGRVSSPRFENVYRCSHRFSDRGNPKSALNRLKNRAMRNYIPCAFRVHAHFRKWLTKKNFALLRAAVARATPRNMNDFRTNGGACPY
jgi:hypothetical protein